MTDVLKTGQAKANGNILTPMARCTYAFIFKPGKAMEEGGKQKYQITLLFPKDADLTLLKKAAADAAMEKFAKELNDATPIPNHPQGWTKGMLFKSQLRSPFRDQGTKLDKPGFESGAFFITCTSDQKPGIVDQNVADILEPHQLYSGCFVRCAVRAFAYATKGNKGVAFGLQHVQKMADGEPLGGRSKPADDFEPVATAGATGVGSVPADPRDIFG